MFVSKKKYQKLEQRIKKLEQQVFNSTDHRPWVIWSPEYIPTLKGKVDAIIKQQRLDVEVEAEKRTVVARKKR